jgi:hypothetical protein
MARFIVKVIHATVAAFWRPVDFLKVVSATIINLLSRTKLKVRGAYLTRFLHSVQPVLVQRK